jgi:hypothetical protein
MPLIMRTPWAGRTRLMLCNVGLLSGGRATTTMYAGLTTLHGLKTSFVPRGGGERGGAAQVLQPNAAVWGNM